MGEEIATAATALFPSPVALCFEKVYMPLLLYGKKMYTGLKYEDAGQPGKRDVKGLACVRKDTCPFIRNLMLKVIDCLLAFDNVAAFEIAENGAEQLLAGEVAVKDLVMSSELAEEYKSDSIAHVKVAGLMKQRDAGSAPKVGDRVEYVWVERENKRAKGFERAEDPEYAARHGIIDYLEYFERQLKVKMQDLMRGMEGADRLFTSDKVQARLGVRLEARDDRHVSFKVEQELKRTKQRTLTSLWTA